MSFTKAAYFDGVNYVSYDANIHATQRFVVIDIIINGELKTIYWEHEKIVLEKSSSNDIIKLSAGTSTLEVSADFLKEVKSKYRLAPYLSSTSKAIFKTNIFLGIGGFVVLMVLIGIFIFSLMGDAIIYLFPKKTEIEFGEMLKKQVFAEQHLVIDSAKTKALNTFYSQVKTDVDYKIQISVVKSDVLNAFALPGGNIVIYSALLNKINKPEQLVALLGHETGHIQKRHSLRSLLKKASAQIVISLFAGDFSGILGQLSVLNDLSYSRENESESDEFAFEIMKTNALNPNGIIQLLEILKTEDQAENIPGVLLTHPKLEERISAAKQEIENNPYSVKINTQLNQSFEVIFIK